MNVFGIIFASRQRRNPRTGSGRRGFTLVELLVVIAIIGILAALLLPTLAAAKARGVSVECKNHLRQMGIALRLYVDENRSYPFADSNDPSNGIGFRWEQALEPYYKPSWWGQREYHCPTYMGQLPTGPNDGAFELKSSYGYNFDGTWGMPIIIDATVPRSRYLGFGCCPQQNDIAGQPSFLVPAVRESEVVVPSEMLAIADSARMAGPGANQVVDGWDRLSPEDIWGVVLASQNQNPNLAPTPLPHYQGRNLVFCDGHVLWRKDSDLLDPRRTWASWNVDHQAHPESWPTVFK